MDGHQNDIPNRNCWTSHFLPSHIPEETNASSGFKSMQVVVRSLGWCELAEDDLTPENSSKGMIYAVIKFSTYPCYQSMGCGFRQRTTRQADKKTHVSCIQVGMQQILTHHHTQSTEWHQRYNLGISSNVYTYMQLKISNIAL